MSLKNFRTFLALVMLGALCAACSATPRSLQPPRVEMVGLAVLSPGAASPRFRVSLLVTNPNTEALPVEALRFSVRLGGEGVLNGNWAEPVTVAAQGQETLRVDVDGDLVSSLSRLLAIVQGPQSALPYELFGSLTLDRRPPNMFPFNASGQVPLSATANR
jgi:LEA14-like dessication related protein